MVFISDTGTGKIHQLKGDKTEVYFESSEFKGVNGLLASPKGMYVLDFGNGNNYQLSSDKKLTSLQLQRKEPMAWFNCRKELTWFLTGMVKSILWMQWPSQKNSRYERSKDQRCRY